MMKEKIKTMMETVVKQLTPFLSKIDIKISELIPNPKVKKIAYVGMGSLFGLMFLIITLGVLISPFRSSGTKDNRIITKKPVVVNSSPEPQKELTESQKEILRLGNDARNLTFPESILTPPVIERDLSI